MKLTNILALSALTASLFGVGCANFSSFQGAETLRKGETLKGAGLTFTKYEIDIEGDGVPEAINVPAAVGWFRAGLTDKFEVNAKAWILLGATIGGKYMILGEREKPGLSVAAGLDVGAIQIGATDPNDANAEVQRTIFDAYVPVYVSYRLSSAFEVYAVPKYLFRAYFGGGYASETEHSVGSAFGMSIGRQSKVYAEVVTMYNVGLGSPALTGGIGAAF